MWEMIWVLSAVSYGYFSLLFTIVGVTSYYDKSIDPWDVFEYQGIKSLNTLGGILCFLPRLLIKVLILSKVFDLPWKVWFTSIMNFKLFGKRD